MIRHLMPADYTTMPWANGMGVTVEMLRLEDENGGLKHRISRASVVQDGPFSTFAQIERNLTVISGPGFDLLGKGIRLRAEPFRPIVFAGDAPVHAANVTAPCDDFNVMSARNLPRPVVQVFRDEQVSADGLLALFALQSGAVNGRDVGRYDLILTKSAAQLVGQFIAVQRLT